LVVEDQAPVLKATRGLLQHLGHECFEAMDGESAIRTYRQHLDSAEPIDIVLLDMTLPGGLHGVDVYRELQMIDPKVQVIATSGYFDDGPNDTITEAGFPASLAKPFTMEALSKTITRLLS
jgi:CheY-like chemotaxis protein